jgi:aminoglycoside phosphotransferase (APT) family kinase protein
LSELLPGGFVTSVVRVGDTVRRPQARGASYVHAVLRYLEARRWPGAPRLLGVDERNREILTFLDGMVAWREDQQAAVRTESNLVRVAELVREFHDLTAGTELARGEEVACHNDLSPRNTIYRRQDLRPVAFIDWDLAAPGRRIHDVAHVCWQYVGLGPGGQDAHRAAGQVRLIADSYGLEDRAQLVDAILWWQNRCWRGIEAQAAGGEPAMVRLRDMGGARQVRDAARWTAAHRALLDAALA